jgi:hypothetical protein
MQHLGSVLVVLLALVAVVVAARRRQPAPPPLIGSECASRGPAYFEACCIQKRTDKKADRSCEQHP